VNEGHPEGTIDDFFNFLKEESTNQTSWDF
jgi:hypothetical protein